MVVQALFGLLASVVVFALAPAGVYASWLPWLTHGILFLDRSAAELPLVAQCFLLSVLARPAILAWTENLLWSESRKELVRAAVLPMLDAVSIGTAFQTGFLLLYPLANPAPIPADDS